MKRRGGEVVGVVCSGSAVVCGVSVVLLDVSAAGVGSVVCFSMSTGC